MLDRRAKLVYFGWNRPQRFGSQGPGNLIKQQLIPALGIRFFGEIEMTLYPQLLHMLGRTAPDLQRVFATNFTDAFFRREFFTTDKHGYRQIAFNDKNDPRRLRSSAVENPSKALAPNSLADMDSLGVSAKDYTNYTNCFLQIANRNSQITDRNSA